MTRVCLPIIAPVTQAFAAKRLRHFALAFIDYMLDAHHESHLTGSTAAWVENLTTSTNPYLYAAWFGDAAPIIHVGSNDNAAKRRLRSRKRRLRTPAV